MSLQKIGTRRTRGGLVRLGNINPLDLAMAQMPQSMRSTDNTGYAPAPETLRWMQEYGIHGVRGSVIEMVQAPDGTFRPVDATGLIRGSVGFADGTRADGRTPDWSKSGTYAPWGFNPPVATSAAGRRWAGNTGAGTGAGGAGRMGQAFIPRVASELGKARLQVDVDPVDLEDLEEYDGPALSYDPDGDDAPDELDEDLDRDEGDEDEDDEELAGVGDIKGKVAAKVAEKVAPKIAAKVAPKLGAKLAAKAAEKGGDAKDGAAAAPGIRKRLQDAGATRWVDQELAPAVKLRVRRGKKVEVTNTGTADAPVWQVRPVVAGAQAGGMVPVNGMVPVSGGMVPVQVGLAGTALAVKAGVKAGARVVGEEARIAAAPFKSTLAAGQKVQVGQVLTCVGYDQMGAILVDSDGWRVKV
jgi:hypothetical protein